MSNPLGGSLRFQMASLVREREREREGGERRALGTDDDDDARLNSWRERERGGDISEGTF